MLGHADALVCPLLLQPFSRNLPHPLLFTSAALTTIRSAFPPHLAALRKLCSDSRCRSNPIAHRVRRKRQRLPPCLLIENASDRGPASPQKSAPSRFRSKLATNRELSSRASINSCTKAAAVVKRTRCVPPVRNLQKALVTHSSVLNLERSHPLLSFLRLGRGQLMVKRHRSSIVFR